MDFEKWHGLGNDFIVVRDAPDEDEWRKRARQLCDRNRGVGADGVLLVGTSPPSMRVINADGSEPEMCGNGLRCAASSIAAATGKDTMEIETGAGTLRCRVEQGPAPMVTVEAGKASFVARDAHVDVDGSDVWLQAGEMGGLVVAIGNPHWVFFDHPGAAELLRVGRILETDERWALRTNVEFVSRVTDTEWTVDVWERGVGITQACGTGATAVAAALVHTERAPANEPLTIHLPGGALEITIDEAGAAIVRGPAQRVFAGTVDP